MCCSGTGAEAYPFCAYTFVRLDTFRDGVSKQRLVELRAAYLVRKRVLFVEGLGKVDNFRFPKMVTGAKLGTVFRHPDLPYLIENTQFLKDWQVHRQQRFANVEPRMVILLNKGDPPTFFF